MRIMSTLKDQSPKIAIAQTEEEKARIFEFRYRVYVEELGKNKLSSANHLARQITDKLDDTGLLFYATEGHGALLATLRVNLGKDAPPTAEQFKIYGLHRFLEKFPIKDLSFTSRLMVTRDKRGSHTLAQLLGFAYEYSIRQGARLDFCHCQPSLVQVYQHLGYRRYKENFVDPDMGYRVPMVLLGQDIEHLKLIRSPFLRVLRRLGNIRDERDSVEWLCQNLPQLCQEASRWLLDEESYAEYLAQKLMPVRHREVPLLANLTERERNIILKAATLIHAKSGDHIIRAGDNDDEMYLLLSGNVEVRNNKMNLSLSIFETGQVFGELGFVSRFVNHLSPVRSADVIAVNDCEILVITQSFIRRMLRRDPVLTAKLAFNLAGILGVRLVTTDIKA